MWWLLLVLAASPALLFRNSLLRLLNWWLYESHLPPHLLSSLPPGDYGLPFIGNMWSFLSAFKSSDPDSFLSSFFSRYLFLLLPTNMCTSDLYSSMDYSLFHLGVPFHQCKVWGLHRFVIFIVSHTPLLSLSVFCLVVALCPVPVHLYALGACRQNISTCFIPSLSNPLSSPSSSPRGPHVTPIMRHAPYITIVGNTPP